MDTKKLIRDKKELERSIAQLLKKFELDTGLIIRDIGLDRDIFNYPSQSGINNVQLEVLLP